MKYYFSGDYPSLTWPSGLRRPLRIVLLGSRQHISDTIKNLHRRGFAEAGEWSEPIPCPDSTEQLLPPRYPDDQISILTKYLQ